MKQVWPASSCIKKAHIKSQNTILEEKALSQIVSKAWTTVEIKKHQKEAKPIQEEKAKV